MEDAVPTLAPEADALFYGHRYTVKRVCNASSLAIIDAVTHNVVVVDDTEADQLEYEAYLAGSYTDGLCSALVKKLGFA